MGSLNGPDRDQLIKKLKNEKGVTVLEVPQNTQHQKEVDLTVFIRMMTLARAPLQPSLPHHIVLISSDTDYIPALRLLSEQGTHVIVVGFKKTIPILNEGLINESYLTFDLEELLEEMEKEVTKLAEREPIPRG
jgi:uncharacterized LabA/DUF88 family protein